MERGSIEHAMFAMVQVWGKGMFHVVGEPPLPKKNLQHLLKFVPRGLQEEVNRPRSPILHPFGREKRGEYLAMFETGGPRRKIADIDRKD